MIKKEWKEEMNSGKLWRSCWEDRGGCGHTKTGLRSQGQAHNCFNITSLFDYWRLCGESELWNQWTCMTQRGKTLDRTELEWLQLPPSLSLCLSLSFSSSASASALWWTNFALLDGKDRVACFISPGSCCCYLFHFLLLVQGIDK